MSKYRVETTGGVYEIETESSDSKPSKQSIFDYLNQDSPVAVAARAAGGIAGGDIQAGIKSRLPELKSSDITMKESPVLGFLQKSGEQAVVAPAHFLNQLAMNAPRSAMNTYTNVQFPEESGNKNVDLAAKGFGVAGAVTSPLARLLGSSIRAGKYGTAALGGAATGAAYSPTEDFGDIRNRSLAGAAGAVLGPAVVGIGAVAPKVNRFRKDIFGASKKLSEAKVNTQVLLNKGEQLTNNYKQAWESLKDASIDDAVLYKNKLKHLSKSNSAIYRTGLDEAEKSFKFDTNNLKELVDESLQELSDQGIGTDSEVFNRLSKLSDDLSPKITKSFDWASMQDVEKIVPAENLTLEKVKNIKSDIFSAADKSSNYKDDIANAIFSKNYGNRIASNNPNFQKMQAEYAPYVEAKKWAYRTFKPQTAEEIPNGNRVLRAIAQGKGQAEHYAYLKRLEEGSGRFQGTGNLRSQSQSMADELQNISNEIKRLQGLKVKNRVDIQTLEALDKKRKYVIFGALATLGAIAGVGNQAKKISSGIQNLLPG